MFHFCYLEILIILILNLYFVWEARWDTGKCRWAEEVPVICIFTGFLSLSLHIVPATPRKHRMLLDRLCEGVRWAKQIQGQHAVPTTGQGEALTARHALHWNRACFGCRKKAMGFPKPKDQGSLSCPFSLMVLPWIHHAFILKMMTEWKKEMATIVPSPFRFSLLISKQK